MVEAVTAVSNEAFEHHNLFRIWATCDKENLASARVLEKSGFVCEGTLARWMVHPNVSEEPRDALVYARTR